MIMEVLPVGMVHQIRNRSLRHADLDPEEFSVIFTEKSSGSRKWRADQ